MATWKKVIVSGSVASLAEVSASVGFKGNLVGSVTGNASTATTLASSVNIGGVSFNGGSSINLPGVNQSGNQDTSGNAATATALATARKIGGVDFDGTGNILSGIISSSAQIGVGDGLLTQNNFTNTLKTKLDGISTSADVTDATTVEAAGALMDSELTDLAGVKGVTISTLQPKPSEGAFANGDKTKLDGIEASADVTDTANVTAAGALMDSELAEIATVKALTAAGISGSLSATALSDLGAGLVSSSAQVSNLAGTNDSTITLTAGNGLSGGGSFTLNQSGAGSVSFAVGVDDSTIELNSDAVRIKDSGVTLAKIANIADDRILGNVSGGSAAPSELTATQIRTLINVESGADVTDATNVTAAGALMDSELTNLAAVKAIDQGLTTSSDVNFNDVVVAGNLTVNGTRTELAVANLNVEDQYILLNSGSTSGDSGIIFGGSNGTAQSGHALILDNSYNTNDGRLAVKVTDTAANSTSDFAAGTSGYYLAGVFEGSEANAATAKADHPGNIRIESNEIYIYV